MSEAYQYALWRSVPDAQRGESINVGVVLYSRRLRFIGARIHLDRDLLRSLSPEVDVAAVAAALEHLLAIVAGSATGGAVAALEPGERFGFLVAPSSTVVRAGPVHTGLCDDPEATLERLYAQLVLRPSG